MGGSEQHRGLVLARAASYDLAGCGRRGLGVLHLHAHRPERAAQGRDVRRKVAEKSTVCRRGGQRPRMCSITSRKPMLSIRSASSSTTVASRFVSSASRPSTSITRPGVPPRCAPLLQRIELRTDGSGLPRAPALSRHAPAQLANLRRPARTARAWGTPGTGRAGPELTLRSRGSANAAVLAAAGARLADQVLALQEDGGMFAPDGRGCLGPAPQDLENGGVSESAAKSIRASIERRLKVPRNPGACSSRPGGTSPRTSMQRGTATDERRLRPGNLQDGGAVVRFCRAPYSSVIASRAASRAAPGLHGARPARGCSDVELRPARGHGRTTVQLGVGGHALSQPSIFKRVF